MHRALLPVASLLASERSQRGISLVCHGIDVWGSRMRPRQVVENFLMRGRSVRVIAVSTFTAGALFGACSATVLPPGLSQEWFSMLVGAADDSRPTKPTNPGLHLLTAFRLEDWKDKGLPQLLAAIAALGRPDAHLTVCGNGEPPSDLRRLIRDHQGCTLRSGLSDRELADELAGADLFVLATRTRCGRTAYGEGFGLVLLEAQVAGTAVIAPAHGGSRDAYIDGMTGVAPVDESAEALTQVLSDLLRDQQRVIQMGQRAAEWARESFAPERYASLAVARLL
jgi:glycosyltransferase involved in cell wall biosynthesis